MRKLFRVVFLCLGVGVLACIFAQPAYAAAPSVVTVVVPTPADRAVTITWTNPASVDFTGTMVRYSTSAFPTTTSDGTLASDVSGSPSGSSSVTVSGLTNGTTYYFSLFSHNAVPEYSTAVNTQQLVMAASFTEDFESLSVANVNGQNGWTVLGGSWSVIDTSGEQTLKSTADATAFQTNRVTNGGNVATYSNQMVRTDWKGSTTTTPGQVFLRAQSGSADAGGYFMWQSGGTLRINYKTSSGATNTLLTSAAFTPSTNTWYTYEFSVVNNSAGLPVLTGYVWARGASKPSTPTVQVTDAFPRFAQGVFSVGKAGASLTEYDNVAFYGMPGDSYATSVPGDGSVTLSWTNPVYASYTGTMVRVSTSTFPTSTSDGTLVGNVTGSSGGTSTTTQTSLSNGTAYYYALYPYDASGVYGSPLYLKQTPYPQLLSDNFESRSVATLAGQDGWTSPGGTWDVTSLSSNKVATGTATATYPTNKVVNGVFDSTTQTVQVRFRSTAATNNAGYVWLRVRPNGKEGYLVWHNSNAWTVSYRDSSSLTEIGTVGGSAAPPMEADTWFNLEATVADNGSNLPAFTVTVWKDGTEKPTTPTLSVTDSSNRSTGGYIAIGKGSASETTYYDNLLLAGVAPGVSITSPAAGVPSATDVATLSIIDGGDTIFIPYIQTSTTLTVTASAGTTVASGGGVEFVLDEDTVNEQTVVDLTAPYSASFTGVAKAEHTIDAYLLDADGTTRLSGATYHDERTNVGVGDIITVVGDSIVEGIDGTIDGGTVLSWLDGDSGTVSADNRNFPQHGTTNSTYKESFLTDMNDKLSTYYGYPVFLMNEGVSGAQVETYSSTNINAAWTARQNALHANKWLIMLGTNDAADGDSAATYETNMTALINTLTGTYNASASSIYLAYPLYRAAFSSTLTGYIAKIDTMRTSLGLAGGPDFYYPFENYTGTEYFDPTHPNATGYIRMARLAALSMTAPVLGTSTYGKNINLTWNDMATLESTVAGYRVSYGTSPTSLGSTVDAGNHRGYVFTSLTPNTNYYFAVAAYDNDPSDLAYSDLSAVSGALRSTGVAASIPPTNGGGMSIPDQSVAEGPSSTQTDTTDEADGSTSVVSPPILTGGTAGVSPYTGRVETVSAVVAGQYIRSPHYNTVYFVADDGTRHPFLDVQTFATYDVSFDDVVMVTDATLPELPLGAPMLPRVGTVLVKIASDPRVYALATNPDDAFRPLLRWIPDETTAIVLYGEAWADSVIDMDATLFARFGHGTTLATHDASPGMSALKRREDLTEAL